MEATAAMAHLVLEMKEALEEMATSMSNLSKALRSKGKPKATSQRSKREPDAEESSDEDKLCESPG